MHVTGMSLTSFLSYPDKGAGSRRRSDSAMETFVRPVHLRTSKQALLAKHLLTSTKA